jgi:hypothetical protein
MPSNKVRLAIGSEKKCESSIWRIWSNKKGDIYVAVRILGGTYKMSLHKDGKCQFGFTAEFAREAEQRFEVKQRHLELWTLLEDNIVRAVQILVPASELRDIKIDKSKDITWLTAPPKGAIGTISVFICKSGETITIPCDAENQWIVSVLDTPLRQAVITYAFTYPDDSLTQLITYEKGRLTSLTKDKCFPHGTRATLWDSRKDHNRHFLELACD